MRRLSFLPFAYPCLFVLFIAQHLGASTAQLNFAPPVRYSPGGNGPNSVAIADLNGDGKLDIVVSNWCINNTVPCPSGAVAVLLGNGDGTFRAPTTYSSGGVYGTDVAIGDLNGDGKPDIVVVNCGNAANNHCIGVGGNAGILFGNGDGTFQPVISMPLGGGGFGAIAVAIADINADGKLDVIVAGDCTSGGCGGVLLGNGDGTFQPEIPFSSAGLIAFSLAIGDLNGDGKLDAVIGNQCATQACQGSTVGVSLGNGDGTFQPAVAYNSGGIYPDGVAIADISGDGKADLVVANSSTSTTINQGDVGVLIGNGDGTFQPVVAYPASEFGAAAIKVADMDGDGKPDVVVVNCSATSGNCNGGGGNVGVLLGNGDGTLKPVVTFPPGGNTPFAVGVADLNGDSRPDIVVGNCNSNVCGNAPGSVAVLLNTSLAPTTTTLTSSLNPSNFGQSVTFTATATGEGFKVTPTGTVTFFDSTTNLGSSNLNASAQATLSTSTLTVGTHSITATYNGDSNYASSTSSAVNQLVQGSIAQLSPTSLNFGNVTVGFASTAQVVTLTNTGNIAMAITSIGTNGDFAQANNCGASLSAGSSCSISVTFKPTTTGTRSGSLSITDNAPNSPQTVSLTGNGVLPTVTLSPTSLTFPTQLVGTTSKAQTVTLTNTGLGILKITKGAIKGPFSETTNCGTTVNPGGSCTISVTFKPTKIGPASGSITITDNAPSSPQTISLQGTGTNVQLTPVSLNFGNQTVGSTSARKIITLTNKGTVTLSISGIMITGTNAGDFAEVNNCGTSVLPAASCSIAVTFTPTATGARSADVSVSDNGGGSPQQVGLTGTGT
jgi:Bacterial Ig-like domain (group 3)/FG-GAP-like repeat/Abnormal spindle-like microcephaly-assoc'd, ASPM-SPD-2-Hydin